jgi:hypothetical protein
MDVCILEGREDHPSPDVDSPRRRGRPLGHLIERPHRRDSVIPDEDRLGRTARTQVNRSSGQK